MKCTGKEWDTCRVEKMGCKGCYYDCISKDKIRNLMQKIDIDIEKNKKNEQFKINFDGSVISFMPISYSPTMVKKALQELLEEGE